MARHEENTKAAIDNSDSNEESTHIEDPIEAWCAREIKRLVEPIRTLGSGVLNQPNKESTALDLLSFLEGYPQVKKDIERYARYALEQQLKEKENDTELH